MTPILDDNEFECSVCGEVFKKINDNSWNEILANKEYKENFPNSDLENREIVCDDCWYKVKPLEPFLEGDE